MSLRWKASLVTSPLLKSQVEETIILLPFCLLQLLPRSSSYFQDRSCCWPALHLSVPDSSYGISTHGGSFQLKFLPKKTVKASPNVFCASFVARFHISIDLIAHQHWIEVALWQGCQRRLFDRLLSPLALCLLPSLVSLIRNKLSIPICISHQSHHDGCH